MVNHSLQNQQQNLSILFRRLEVKEVKVMQTYLSTQSAVHDPISIAFVYKWSNRWRLRCYQ
jgi:hypothetical protein